MQENVELSEVDTTGGSRHIAVAGIFPDDRSKPRSPRNYTHALELAGAHPIVLSTFPLAPGEEPLEGVPTLTELDPEGARLPDEVAGLVLPGGGDINPARYGQEPHPRTRNTNDRRDAFELNLLSQALEREIPVLAICRGMQLLNVYFGGTLDQHLADTEGHLDHDRDRPRAEPAHGARFTKDTLMAEVLGQHGNVNSHHHQGLDEVADELTEIGWADDGVIEAVVAPDHQWVIGVQWHPEVMAPVDHTELEIFKQFVAATESSATSLTAVRSA